MRIVCPEAPGDSAEIDAARGIACRRDQRRLSQVPYPFPGGSGRTGCRRFGKNCK